ncbi:MAG TPA: cell division protein ZapA [Beijerinckia sp.]|nr:cell division protein ZapA [Beijerinckia sp.]
MAQVSVTIAGRAYRIACGEGEEARLQELARKVDSKIDALKQGFGEIGDQRLIIMAAITIADELSEANGRIGKLEAALAAIEASSAEVSNGEAEWAGRLADSLNEVAGRIERVAHDLNSQNPHKSRE